MIASATTLTTKRVCAALRPNVHSFMGKTRNSHWESTSILVLDVTGVAQRSIVFLRLLHRAVEEGKMNNVVDLDRFPANTVLIALNVTAA